MPATRVTRASAAAADAFPSNLAAGQRCMLNKQYRWRRVEPLAAC